MEDRDCGVRLMEDGRFPCHALVLISLEAEIKHHGGHHVPLLRGCRHFEGWSLNCTVPNMCFPDLKKLWYLRSRFRMRMARGVSQSGLWSIMMRLGRETLRMRSLL